MVMLVGGGPMAWGLPSIGMLGSIWSLHEGTDPRGASEVSSVPVQGSRGALTAYLRPRSPHLPGRLSWCVASPRGAPSPAWPSCRTVRGDNACCPNPVTRRGAVMHFHSRISTVPTAAYE